MSNPRPKKADSVVLGVCPIGKFVFSHEDALRQKAEIFERLDRWNIDTRNIDTVLPDGMVRDQKHVRPVVAYFKEQNIDALFVPHCNFGTEGAVGMIARELGVPVLLWGPRDEAPLEDGSRYRDSLCGMFASSKVIRKLKVPFTYIENCRVDDPPFREGMDRFLRAAAVVKAMRTMRIAQIGVRVDFFWTTIDNESELLEKFGVEVLPIDMADFLKAVQSRSKESRPAYQSELKDLKEWLITDGLPDEEGLLSGLALRDELRSIAEQEQIDGFSIKTFTSIPTTFGPGIGLGVSLAQEEFALASESDLHGAISSVLIEAAAQSEEPCFFPEYTVRHPDNDNAILLWHGAGPFSLRHPDIKKVPIKAPWILKDLPPNSFQFRLKDGPLTVCRFDGDTDGYVLGIGEGKTVPGPETREFYLWMEVDDWLHWERTIMAGPYIHHCSAAYGHYGDALQEACRYIPHLQAQRFDRGQP